MSDSNNPFPTLPPPPDRSSSSAPSGFPPAPTSGLPPAPASAPYTPPPPYAAPPYTGGQAHGSHRSGMAVAALVLGLVSLVLFITVIIPLLAFIFGLVAASSIKKSSGKLTGLSMARAGWILGLLGLLGAAAAITAIAIDESNDTDVSVDELEIGACYDLPSSDPDETITVTSLEPVPCDEPHEGELYHQYEMNPDEDRDYPSEDDVFTEAATECVGDPWRDYVGIDYQQSKYEPYVIVPLELNWKIDGGEASCFVVSADESLITGSVRGSGE